VTDANTETAAAHSPRSASAPGRDAAGEQYQRIRRELMLGHFEPGTLLQETTISAGTGVSRTPVREALARLEQDGLLVRAPRGYRVRTRSRQEVMDIFEARILLEGHAASGAALRRSDLDLAELRRLLDRSGIADDPEALWQNDTDFHLTLRQASRNEAMCEVLLRLDAQLSMHGRYINRRNEGADVTTHEHEAIVDAIARQDPDAARELITGHLTRVRDLRVASMPN
jgi:DNA-binding GntR family transcriptional regulator